MLTREDDIDVHALRRQRWTISAFMVATDLTTVLAIVHTALTIAA